MKAISHSNMRRAGKVVNVLPLGLLVPLLFSLWLAGCGGGSDLAVAPTPRLESVDNFRDIAGTDDQEAYRTASGRQLRRGVVYRSNALAPSASDLATLNTLGILAVYDLRSPGEIAKKPDIPPAGANYLNIDILGEYIDKIPAPNSAAEAFAMMESTSRALVTDPGMRDRLAQLFRALATTGGSQVYHCSAGKDRTGWVTAVLLSLLDVPQSVIVQDYLLTNTYSAASIQASYQALVAAYGKDHADAYLPTMVADQRYLAAGFDQAAASYGSMAGYITYGLGLDAATQAQLRGKLLR